MASLGKMLKDEIQRLARREASGLIRPLKQENIKLKKAVAALKRETKALAQAQSKGSRVASAAPASAAATPAGDPVVVTSRNVRSLRNRHKLTQAQSAKLLGVSGQAVYTWEKKGGRITMRSAPLAAFVKAQAMSKEEVREALGIPAPKRGRKPSKKKATPKKKAAKKKAAKKKVTKKKATTKKATRKTATKKKATKKKVTRKKVASKKKVAKKKPGRKPGRKPAKKG